MSVLKARRFVLIFVASLCEIFLSFCLPRLAQLHFKVMEKALATEDWGLDPVFRSYAQLFIMDILKMQPYPTGSSNSVGVFAYKNHPIRYVDVIGIVTKVNRRERCNIYNLDDGTGTIPCVCWKPEPTGPPAKLPLQLKEKFHQIIQLQESMQEGYDVGDLLHVRGNIKIYYDKLELMCSFHAKLDDPNLETVRMMEQISLYREVYDHYFEVPNYAQTSPQQMVDGTSIRQSVLNMLEELRPQTVSLESMLDFIADKVATDETLLAEAVKSLEESGYLYKPPGKSVYLVVEENHALHITSLSVLKRECMKQKYQENGCHTMHLLEELRTQLTYAHLPKSAVKRVLDKMEENSEIIGLDIHSDSDFDKRLQAALKVS